MAVAGYTECRIGAIYLRLRAEGCGFHLSDMSWHCRDDRRAYPGRGEPCDHVKQAIPTWAEDL